MPFPTTSSNAHGMCTAFGARIRVTQVFDSSRFTRPNPYTQQGSDSVGALSAFVPKKKWCGIGLARILTTTLSFPSSGVTSNYPLHGAKRAGARVFHYNRLANVRRQRPFPGGGLQSWRRRQHHGRRAERDLSGPGCRWLRRVCPQSSQGRKT